MKQRDKVLIRLDYLKESDFLNINQKCVTFNDLNAFDFETYQRVYLRY